MKADDFKTEADMVADFCARQQRVFADLGYTAYHETADWDLLLAHCDGHQIGIEAKLKLNVKVLAQALPAYAWRQQHGPDFRAVLVPMQGLQADLAGIAHACGINIIAHDVWPRGPYLHLPASYDGGAKWHPWFPSTRENLPEYVPDVIGGRSAPLKLSEWKIQAMKMLILVSRRPVHRADFAALKLSPSRWLAGGHGYLQRSDAGWIACDRTPDLRREHPTIWAQIEADFDKWAPPEKPGLISAQPVLFEGVPQ